MTVTTKRYIRGKIPVVPPERLIEAMHRFDNEIRHLPRWATWEHHGLHKFAVSYQGQLYPIKQIVSLATGKSYNEFSGGTRTNSYVVDLGFQVVTLDRDRRSVRTEEVEEESIAMQISELLSHTHLQWLLARIGHSLGCDVWVASNDLSKQWNGQPLSQLSLRSLPPLGLGTQSQQLIQFIDVLWLQRNQLVAAFEVENTTSIYSGLLRLADLTALSPNLNFNLYIVAPEARSDKVKRELCRPAIQALKLHERCSYISHESLVRESDAMMKWAHSPSAIHRLSVKVDAAQFQ